MHGVLINGAVIFFFRIPSRKTKNPPGSYYSGFVILPPMGTL